MKRPGALTVVSDFVGVVVEGGGGGRGGCRDVQLRLDPRLVQTVGVTGRVGRRHRRQRRHSRHAGAIQVAQVAGRKIFELVAGRAVVA